MSDLTNRIDSILTKNKLRRADLCRGTGINEGTIRKWIAGSAPNVYMICQVADFLDVSVEYLVNGSDKAVDKYVLKDNEKQLLDVFRQLPERDQTTILTIAESLSKSVTK